jgi:iron complex transport system substrate-binding protein
VGTVLMYTLAPDIIAGWNYKPDPGELALMVEPYRNLPVLGGFFGKNSTGNLEEIMKAKPDLIISMGDVLAGSAADRLEKQTQIPVVVLDGKLKSLPESYEQAGELLGKQQRAAVLAAYARDTLRDIEEKLKTVPAGARRRYYYAEGPTGLETEPGDSTHCEALAFAGGFNVASLPSEKGMGYGHSAVSMEQVLRWNPEIVVSGYDHVSSPGEFYSTVWTNPRWRLVKAVRDREVYEMPQYPYSWIDRPPSANRLIGIKWLANLFYPELFPYDMRMETRTFYALFYHVQLTDKQLDLVLGNALRKHKKQ